MSEPLGELPTVTSTADTTFVVITDTVTSQKIAISDLRKTLIPYSVYKALITQSGTGDPTVIVLENTLGGDIVWTRSSLGIYNGVLSGAFPDANKFFAKNGFVMNVDVSSVAIKPFGISRVDSDNIKIQTGTTSTLQDGVLNSTPIEIQVYF